MQHLPQLVIFLIVDREHALVVINMDCRVSRLRFLTTSLTFCWHSNGLGNKFAELNS